MATPLEVPELVRQQPMAHGIAGGQWRDDLPLVVDTLAEQWGLEIGILSEAGRPRS